MHADTLDAKTVTSKRGNKHAHQIFATMRFGWCCAFPLKAKSDALFARGGVPHVMEMDGAREQTLQEEVPQGKPHSPWMNAAESGVPEVKKTSAW
jgi:hypothetical protein